MNHRLHVLFSLGVVCMVLLAIAVGAASAAPSATYDRVFGAPYATASNAQSVTTQQYTGAGSWYKLYPGTKTELYIDPALQLGGAFTIDQIQSITYHTLANNPSGVDFFTAIYTMPGGGTNCTGAWYCHRLNGEPYLANGYVAPADGVWNNWTTDAPTNQLTFFDQGNCGSFGFYGAPTLQDIQAGGITWSSYGAGNCPTGLATPIDYGGETVKYLSFQTGSGWASFAGYLDAISIALTTGDTYVIDLESKVSEVWVDDDWAGSAPGVEVATGKFFGYNAFATIQDGINNVSGSTVHVEPGTYIENVVIDKSLTLDGAGAGTNPALHTILDGATLGDSSGISINSGVTGVTIQDLRVQNYVTAGDTAGIYAAGGNNNFTAQHLQVNGNTGGRGGLFMNGPVDTVLIDDVQAHYNGTRGIVIWNGFKTHITLTNNDVQYNNCCGIELQDGTASGVTATGNVVENNTDSGMAFIGLKAGAGANLIANNTLRNNGRFGIEIKLPSGNGNESGDGSIVVSGNLVEQTIPITTQRPSEERDLAGIAVYRRGWVSGNGNVDIPTGVVVKENTVNGYQQTNASSTSDGFGIVVEGTNMKVLNNIVTTSDVGIQMQQGHLPYTANTATDGDQSDLADTFFGRGNSPTTSGVILNNSLSGNSVGMRNVGVPAASASLTCNWWGDLSGPASGSNPGGLGQSLTGSGAFSPWLIYGTDTSADPGLQMPASFTVTAGSDTSAADNGYRRLANAVGCVKSGQTVNLSGTFNFGSANALASWALGTDAVTGTNDDYEVDAPANANGVTLTAASLGAATIQGPGDVASIDLEGFLQFYNNGSNQNWTISNLRILDFDLGIGMFCCGGSPANAYEGATITGNLIRLAEDLKGATVSGPENLQNIGIHLAYGKNQTISNNTIEIPGDGASDPSTSGGDWWTYGASPGWLYSSHVALQSNTHGGDSYDGLLITGNTIKVLDAQSANPSRIIGIWENGHSHSSDITVSNNQFQNLAAGNDPALNRQMAFRVTSHSSASTSVAYAGNTVEGASMAFGSLDVGAGLLPVQLTNNIVTDAKTGMLMKANNKWHLTGNSLSNAGGMAGVGTGVEVGATSAATMDTTANLISGFATGVKVDGALTASDSLLVSNQTGVLVQGSGTATLSNNSIANNSVKGVDNTAAAVVMAENNWWGSTEGPSDPAGTLEMPENPGATVAQMLNAAPAGLLGNAVSDNVDYYPWGATPPAGYLQSLINAAAPCDVINLAPGVYEGATVDKCLTIRGVPGVIITEASPGLTITADDVTVENLTLDGNPSGSSPKSAFPGVLVQAGADNFTLQNVQVLDWEDGVEVAGSVNSLKIVDNWFYDNTDAGLQVDSLVVIGGVITIEGNLFKFNGGNGIQNDGATASLPAEYNSWGDIDGYQSATGGDGIGGSVLADPFGFAELFLDVVPDTLATIRNANEDDIFNVAVRVDAAGLYAVAYKLSYDTNFLTLQSVTDGGFKGAGACTTSTVPAGTVTVYCSRQAPDADVNTILPALGTVSTVSFKAAGPGLTGAGPWTTHLDLSTEATELSAGARGGVKVWVNNGGFGADSGLPGHTIIDDQDGQINITGLANFTGYVDLQGRTNDSAAAIEVYNQATKSGATKLAQATSAAGGAYTTAYVGANQLYVGATYYLIVDRALYLPTTAIVDTDYGNSKLMTTRPLTTLLNVKLLGGDATNDDIVDISDAACIGGSYGSAPVVCGVTGTSDVNGDVKVDLLDLVLMGGNYSLTSSPWTP